MMEQRSREVDYQRVEQLQYLGNYERELGVTMARMMENALDWEHLSHVHASSFTDIEKMEAGPWGWRAKAMPAVGEGEWQTLELLLDAQRHYWATSVISGPAQSIEIHTQATTIDQNSICVDVRFYSSIDVPEEQVSLYLDVLQQQYALLYDEDEQLMQGRQAALDARDKQRTSRGGNSSEPVTVLVGRLDTLSRDEPITVSTDRGRFCVRHREGRWLVHSAVCPHLLGPLDSVTVAQDGTVTCPWHGYRFDVASGENVDGKCRALAPAPEIVEIKDELFLSMNSGY